VYIFGVELTFDLRRCAEKYPNVHYDVYYNGHYSDLPVGTLCFLTSSSFNENGAFLYPREVSVKSPTFKRKLYAVL
jgi:hypothetical protein